jgi:predicted esterase
MTIPWPLVPPLSGVLDGALGLNVTYIGLLPPGSAPAAGTRTVLQLVSDPDYDAEGRDGRRVKRISLEEGRLKSPVVRARLTRTFGADDDATALEVGVLTAKSGRAEFLAEVFPAEDPRPGEDPAPSRRVSRSVASCQLYQGRNRFRHDFRAANLKGGRYLLSLDVSVNGRPQGHADLPFYKLRLEELAALRERYDRAVTRAGGRLHRVLPSMAIRFQWLDELRTRLDPAHDPRPLRETYDEVGRMVAALEAGRDPFSGSAGYQRRAFRSKIDGSLQPYSVHIPSAAAENPAGRHPLLVMLHGSGVDETAAARSPGLVRELDARGWLLCAPLGRDLSGWYLGDSGRDIFEAIDAARATLPVDDRAIFLAGFSMGGYGVWRHGPLNRQNFAGLAVLSGRTQNPFGPAGGAGAGGPDPDDPSRYLDKTVGLPVFVAHGSDDAAVPVGSTREFVGRLREAGAWVVYHEYAGAGHGDYDAWTELFEWMEKVRRGEAAGDTPQPQAPEPR